MISAKSFRCASAGVPLLAASCASAVEIVTVSGRKGETQSYLLMHNAPPPKAIAVMFPGGEGLPAAHRSGLGQALPGRRELPVRTRGVFRDNEIAVAIVDAPSDQQRRNGRRFSHRRRACKRRRRRRQGSEESIFRGQDLPHRHEPGQLVGRLCGPLARRRGRRRDPHLLGFLRCTGRHRPVGVRLRRHQEFGSVRASSVRRMPAVPLPGGGVPGPAVSARHRERRQAGRIGSLRGARRTAISARRRRP